MSDTTQAFFERLTKRGYEPLLHSVTGTFRWDIDDVGSWYVTVNNGTLSVSRDTLGADCVAACSKEDFERMVVGKQNPTTLFMQGRMKFAGNPGLALMIQRLFPDESLSARNRDKGEKNG